MKTYGIWIGLGLLGLALGVAVAGYRDAQKASTTTTDTAS